MKSLFKSFFQSDKNDGPRTLNHPRELQIGDIVRFRYLPQAELSDQRFEVTQVNTYDFEDRNLTELVLKNNNNQTIYLTVDETDDEPFLAISKKIQRATVEKLFDLDEFALLFDSEEPTQLNRLSEPTELSNWTSEKYIQEIYEEGGYFHRGDYRNKTVPQDESEGDVFEYFTAINDKRTHLIEAEVYEDGDTDVLVTLRYPIDYIEEMWPNPNAG